MRRAVLGIGAAAAAAIAVAVFWDRRETAEGRRATEEAADTTAALSGHLLPHAKPAAGPLLVGIVRRGGAAATATVRAWRLDTVCPGVAAHAEAEGIVRGGTRAPDVETKTDTAGRFRLVSPAADLTVGCRLLAAFADGLDVWRVATDDDADLELPDGPLGLVVRAVHQDGRPFQGGLRLSEGDQWGRSADETPRFAVPVGSDGVAAFRGLRPRLMSLVALAPPTFESAPMTVLLPREGELRMVVDGPRRTVRGRVLDAEGRGVSDATVVVEPTVAIPGAFSARTRTDAGGAFVVDACEGRVRARASAAGFLSGSSEATAGATDVEVRLRRAGRIHGVARDGQTGLPAVGVRVALSRPSRRGREFVRAHRHALTDAQGRFAFDDVEEGEVSVVAFGAGRMTRGLRDTSPFGFNPLARMVRPGEDLEVPIALEPAAALKGRVTTSEGTPIAHAQVQVRDRSFLHVPEPEEVETDAEGRYAFATLLPRLRQRVWVFPPNRDSQLRDVFAAEGETVTLDVVVPGGEPAPSVPIDVRVVSEGDQTPIAGATLYGVDAEGRARTLGTSGPDGRAHLTGVVGPVLAWAEGFSDKEGRAEAGVLVLSLPRRPFVEGRVLWPDGGPAAGVEVTYAYSKGPEITTTDAEGHFRGVGLFEKRFPVSARARRGEETFTAEAPGSPGTTDLLLRLAPDAARTTSRRLRVLGPDGVEVVSCEVAVEGEIDEVRRDRGLVEVWARDGVAPVVEIYAAVASTGGPAPGPARVSLPSERGETRSVRLPVGTSLGGRVIGEKEEGIEGVRIQAFLPGAPRRSAVALARTGNDGAFLLEGLGDLDYVIRVVDSTRFVAVEDVRARAGGAPVVLRLSEAVRPWVDVVDPSGASVADAEVRALVIDPQRPWDDSLVAVDRTDSRGRARLEGIPQSGPLTLRVVPRGDELLAGRIEGWRPVDTRIVLEKALVLSGRLRTPAGTPLRAEIEVKGDDIPSTAHDVSEGDGRFRLTGMPAGRTKLAVTLGRWPWGREVEMEVSAPATDLDIVVDEGDVLELAIEPKPKSEVRWQAAEGDDPAGPYSSHVFSAKDRFVIHGVEADHSYSVYVEARGEVAIARGVKPSGTPVRLRLGPSRSVSGHVRAEGSDSDTARGCQVLIEGPGFTLEAHTDEEGAFTVERVPPGTWTARAIQKRGDIEYEARTRVEAGATDVELPLRRR